MKPNELLATATVPGSAEPLRLYHHDGAFTLRLGRVELMSSRVHGSEDLLAELALAPLGANASRVMVGGLGMGFTLARVLALVGPATTVDVVELVPEVVAWNAERIGACAGHPLRDPRVVVHVADVGAHLVAVTAPYDAILLDVDNGPDALARADNDALYDHRGLAAARRALRPSGVLAVWSSANDAAFVARFRAAGFHVETHAVRARGRKGPRRTIWVGTATAGPATDRRNATLPKR